MFYSLLALGIAYEFHSSKHTQLIGWFNKNFINAGLFDKDFGKIINKAYNRRTKGDYDTYIEFNAEIIFDMFEDMKRFISIINHHLVKDAKIIL